MESTNQQQTLNEPKTNFIEDYQICTQNNEVPPTFHLFSSLVALSSLVSSRVWLDLGLFIIRPNLYVVLTGDPGVKKSTAMSVTKRLLRTFSEQVPLSAEAQTKEALVLSMSNKSRVCSLGENEVPDRFAPMDEKKSKFMYSPMTVCVTELSQFVGAASGHMIDFLTTVYDEEVYTNETKNKGVDRLPMPYLSVLACTVPDWITARLKDDVITGGFSRRTIFVYEHSCNKRVAIPQVTKEMEAAWDRLIIHARRLLTLKGAFVWDEGARDFYVNWYNNLKPPDDPLMKGWFNSVHVQMLKIAMLLSAAERFDLILTVKHMQTSIDLLKLVEKNIPKVFKGVGRNELFGISNKVLELLEYAKGNMLPESYVKKELFREADISEIAKILTHLVETGRIERVVGDNKKPALKLKR